MYISSMVYSFIKKGCDYLDSPPGIGVKRALKLLEKTDAYSLIKSWKTWGQAVKAPKLPKNYTESFQMADWTFQHQRFDSSILS